MGVERQVREEAALCEGCACCSSCRAEGGSGKSTLLKIGTLSLEWVGWVGLVPPVYCSPDWSCLSAKNSCTGKSILFAFSLSWARGLIPHHLWSLRGETRRECRGTDHGSVTFLVPSWLWYSHCLKWENIHTKSCHKLHFFFFLAPA